MLTGENVYLLTEAQKDLLVGQEFAPDEYFGPTQDADDNWIIGLQEVENCVNEEFMWVKDLPMIVFVPKPFEM